MLAMRGGLSIGGLLWGMSADLLGVRYALIVMGCWRWLPTWSSVDNGLA